ncbi:hypothetical protein JTE90_008306 [Oedothorax gibbosus]|uniref:G-protein coupled receptors family 1 profile domain-containing protein n=1 Tax=Oedothorax gibbosus TaxID=931172 RepID=A0AAV6UGS8_9ARAC|nr:hypothetical protein JTE90_008306 [Oedothorax gibbosus]
MPLSALTFLERDWNYGETLCKIFPLVRYSNGAVSLFSVMAITINRYVLIVHPNIYKTMYGFKSVAFMILLMWTCSLVLLLFPWLELWGRFGYDPKVGTCSILQLNGQSPKMALYIVAFGLPSLIFVVCYSRIFYVVHQSSKSVLENSKVQPSIESLTTFSSKRKGVIWKSYKTSDLKNNKESTTPRNRQDLKVLKVILVIFLTFVICYFPVAFVKIFRKEDDLPVLNVLGYLGVYFSNIVNPVIYVVISDEYRKAYKDLFCTTKSPKLERNNTIV